MTQFLGNFIPTCPLGENYDAISNDAYFNQVLLETYLAELIATFTILREPLL